MKQIDIYTTEGKKSGKVIIPKNLEVEIKPKLIQQAYQAELSQKRFPTAHTKNRGQVSGSGRKPWRQKGTGRARAGSIRSPLWRGGGIIFGPTPARNFAKRIPKKQRQKAIFSALASKIKDKKIIIIAKIEQNQIKTKEFEVKINHLPIDGPALIVCAKIDEKVKKSAENISYLKVILVQKINLIDILNYDYIIFEKDALSALGKKNDD
jgi:large subunit ribosomal protein L4